MTPDPGRDSAERSSTAQEAERRRRRAKVFGDVLPEQTRDDRSSDTSSADRSPDGSSDAAADEWLRAQVPPHHG